MTTCQRLIAGATLYVCEANALFRRSDRKSKIMETLEVKSRLGAQLEQRGDDKTAVKWNSRAFAMMGMSAYYRVFSEVVVGTCVLSVVY